MGSQRAWHKQGKWNFVNTWEQDQVVRAMNIVREVSSPVPCREDSQPVWGMCGEMS